jgi:hypothetical protein
MSICPQCKCQNPIKAKFCINCGNQIKNKRKTVSCLNCGTDNLFETKFCVECGILINKNSDLKTDFNPQGSLEDFRSDLDLLQKFVAETTHFIDNSKIKIHKGDQMESEINLKLEEIQTEINDNKKILDSKLKVLNSDIILIDLIPDENSPIEFKIVLSSDEAKLNKFVDFYKSKYNQMI